ncbi:hypothetical protein GCM10007905_34490 [Mixta theicola]|nr:hypothetical protein GCM10007905_34490 [Mixta theicola]
MQFPMDFEKEFNLPIISLTISGDKHRFIFDTGTQNGLHLPAGMIKQIPALRIVDGKQKSIDLAGQISETRAFFIDHLDIAGLRFNNINGTEYKPWGLDYASPVESQPENDTRQPDYPVIGLSFFHDHIITLDFPASTLIVDDGQPTGPASAENGWIALPFVYNRHEGLVISVSDGEKDYKFILDSAASTSVIKSHVLAKRTVTKFNKEDDYSYIEVMLTGLQGQAKPIEAIMIDSLPDEFQADGLLGVNFLQQYIIKIDQKNKQLWLMPAHSAVG